MQPVIRFQPRYVEDPQNLEESAYIIALSTENGREEIGEDSFEKYEDAVDAGLEYLISEHASSREELEILLKRLVIAQIQIAYIKVSPPKEKIDKLFT